MRDYRAHGDERRRKNRCRPALILEELARHLRDLDGSLRAHVVQTARTLAER